MRTSIAEHVTEGHPDKIADQISDAVLDAYLRNDPEARVGCECLVTRNLVVVAGEVTSTATVDVELVVRNTLIGIGYDSPASGLDGPNCRVTISLQSQSPELNQIVAAGNANDQSTVIGYATNETPEYMPQSYVLARSLAQRLSLVRRERILPCLLPDGKTQVCLDRTEDALTISSLVVSPHHQSNIEIGELREQIIQHVIHPVIPEDFLASHTRIFINETGTFHIGGPDADTGLTGRKIVVDTYGDMIPFGGGAFSGKDPSKIDRTGAYFARYIAKNIVASGFATQALVKLGYAKGVEQPILFEVLSGEFPRHMKASPELETVVRNRIRDMSFLAIIDRFKSKSLQYSTLACWGHFGRSDIVLPWELVNLF